MEVHCDKVPGASLPALPAIAVARIGLHRSVRPGFCALIEQRHEATGAYGAAELNNATGCGSWRYGTAEFDWDFAC